MQDLPVKLLNVLWHPLISQCTRLYDLLPGTHNVGLSTRYPFNAGPATQPIAGSMLFNRTRRWPNIETELSNCPVFALTAIRVTLYPPKGHYPNNTINSPDCKIMLGHRLWLWADIILTKNLFSEYFLNMKVLHLGNSCALLVNTIKVVIRSHQVISSSKWQTILKISIFCQFQAVYWSSHLLERTYSWSGITATHIFRKYREVLILGNASHVCPY